MKMISTKNFLTLLVLGVGMVLLRCKSHESSYEIHEFEIKPNLANGNMPKDGFHNFSSGQMGEMGSRSQVEIKFDTPKGWVSEPGSGMRAATFKIADGDSNKEATIVILPNANDGFIGNISRWLGQINIVLANDQLSQFIEERQKFVTVNNADGSFFDFTKLEEFGRPNQEYMLASILKIGNKSVFVKLTGNVEFLSNHKESLLTLSKSIRFSDKEDLNETGAAGVAQVDPNMQTSDPNFNQVADGVSELSWQTPEGWKSLNASGMRTGSFEISYNGKKADGSIIQLPGPAGGIENNVRRWMEQIGAVPMDEQEFQKFLSNQKKVQTRDGYKGILVDLTNLLSGDLTQGNSIVAVIISTERETIFLKLTGPKVVLKQNVDALAELSSSLKMAS